jgi:Xaa-Pro aminopeptidase
MEAPADSTWRGYSLAERDRRWAAVRKNAAAASFDCIFVPQGNGTDARYLTQRHEVSVVLPTDDRPPIAVSDRGGERGAGGWLTDIRATERAWAGPMAQMLLDLRMERARIGVAGLKGGTVTHVRNPDGVVNYSAFAEMVRRLPNATFEDATDVVGFARYVKSHEEVACLRRAAACAEAGIEELAELARPGLDQAVLYARVMGRMLDLGSEYYPLALYVAPLGEEAGRNVNPPIGKRLQAGDYITDETSAVWGGQVAQEDQPLLLGQSPAELQKAVEVQREVWEAGLAMMKPGLTFGELLDFAAGYGKSRGLQTTVTMHGRGIGDDNGPLISSRSTGEAIRSLRMEAGNVWIWKPAAATADGRLSFQWGGDVLVTERGGERLFKRPHGLIAIS